MPKFIKPEKKQLTNWAQSAFSDNIFKAFLALWFLPLLGIIIYTIFYFNQLPNQIPLFYSHIWGEQQLAFKKYLFLPVGGTLLLGIFNFGLAISLHLKDKVSSYLLAGSATLIALLCTITIFNIINLIK